MKRKQAPIVIRVRALIQHCEEHGFVWRLLRGEQELLRDIAPTNELGLFHAQGARDAILTRERAAALGVKLQ